ncbi:hypothetical protein WISP_113962 [Willisornis vidua]|uniref:Reverse transcriptase domain-containing protein n=1 Tax=Willisornis vidua TaxID=1566151 RepID=A0ABQ9D0G0_9PASS|nr:hypothetical protein WISP_113962 [Willisornis vidua]
MTEGLTRPYGCRSPGVMDATTTLATNYRWIKVATDTGPLVHPDWGVSGPGGSQELSVVEAYMSLTGDQWEKHSIVTGPEAPCILAMDYLKRGHFKDPKGYRWAFGVATVIEEKSKELSTLPGLSEDPSAVGLLRVKDQDVPIAYATVHRRQYRTNRDAVIPIHKMIRKLESQGVVSRTHSPFNSPIWPVCKSDGEWRLTVDYHGLNEVTSPLSAAVPDVLELQYELESKAAKWYGTIDIANAFFSIPLAADAGRSLLSPGGVCSTPRTDCPRGETQSYHLPWANPGSTREGRSYKGSEANYTPMEKEILVAYEGIRVASEVTGTEAQLFLAPRLPVLRWMFKGKVPSTHHATDATWSKWIALIMQRVQIGSSNCPGVLEIITNWPEGGDFNLADEKEEESVSQAEEALPYNQLPDEETRYALFTDGSCRIVGKSQKWKAAVWSPTRWVAEATKGKGESSQFGELKAVIRNCETCAAIKQAKRLEPLWYGGCWDKYKYGEAWQVDYVTLPQTSQAIRFPLVDQDGTTKIIINYSLEQPSQLHVVPQNLKIENPVPRNTCKNEKLPEDLTVKSEKDKNFEGETNDSYYPLDIFFSLQIFNTLYN